MRMPESENPFILSRSPIPPSPCSVWGLLIHPTLKVKVRVIVLVTRVVPSNPLQYNVYDTCTHNNRAITDSNYYHFSSLHKKASYCSTSLSIFFIYTHEWYINILLRQMCTHVAPDYWQIIALQGIKLGILRPRPGYLGWWGRSVGLSFSKQSNCWFIFITPVQRNLYNYSYHPSCSFELEMLKIHRFTVYPLQHDLSI